MLPNASFWHGKRVLLTGHTGFKGAWLALWLQRLGAEVTGLALPPVGERNLFELAGIAETLDHHVVDIRDANAVAAMVRQAQPQVVLHLAAQALVRASYRAPLETFSSNVMGTAHVLDALRGLESVRSVVAVTTDKVYRNQESAYPYRENDALGGHDPYSASKAACEIVIQSYRDAYLEAQGVAVASARAGNVIGGGDWSEDRLIPDTVRAWESGKSLMIRRPQAVRPWQHVLEPLAGYLVLAEKLWIDPKKAGAYNLGPQTHETSTVEEVVTLARTVFGMGEWISGDSSEGPHEAGWLALEIALARERLGVQPKWSLQDSVRRTMNWYRQLQTGIPARSLCDADLDAYEAHPCVAS